MNTNYPKDEVERVRVKSERVTIPRSPEPGWHARGDTERRHHPAREDDATNEERATVPDAHSLHVFQDASAGDWCVWLNTDVSDFDGLTLSIGRTRDEAVAQAVAVLERAAEALQQPSPIR